MARVGRIEGNVNQRRNPEEGAEMNLQRFSQRAERLSVAILENNTRYEELKRQYTGYRNAPGFAGRIYSRQCTALLKRVERLQERHNNQLIEQTELRAAFHRYLQKHLSFRNGQDPSQEVNQVQRLLNSKDDLLREDGDLPSGLDYMNDYLPASGTPLADFFMPCIIPVIGIVLCCYGSLDGRVEQLKYAIGKGIG